MNLEELEKLEKQRGKNIYSLDESVKLLKMNFLEDKTELIYKHYGRENNEVFKIIISVVDGKLHYSDKIYAKVIPYRAESYEFE